MGFAPQHISEVELAKASASEAFVAAADRALGAEGRLLALHPAVRIEQVVERERRQISDRSTARASSVGSSKRAGQGREGGRDGRGP
jgi:hypothetical protein